MPTPVWTACASENSICNFSGTRQVRYGANGIYAFKTATDSIGCNNDVFGDPTPNAYKSCQYADVQSPPTGPITLPPVTLSTVGWIASASSSTGGQDLPAAALDNNLASRWSTGSAQTGGQWFQVDMTKPQVFNQITLDAGPSTGDQPRNYQVFVSNDGQSWGDPVAGGAGSSQVTSVTFVQQQARYIRIVQTGSTGNWWSIAEFHAALVATPVQENLSRTGWSLTASSSENGQNGLSQAIDGNSGTRWSTGTAQNGGQWFKIDMGTTQLVNRLILDAGTSQGDYPRAYQIFASADGFSWGLPIAQGNGTGQITDIRFPFHTARYVMITQDGSAGNWWSIAEILLMH